MRKDSEDNTTSQNKRRKTIPGRTPEERENQLIALAWDLAEEKLRKGTASSQLITLLLSQATRKAKLELDKLRSDVEVANARVKALENQETSKELYTKAIAAFKSYSGAMDDEDDEDDY